MSFSSKISSKVQSFFDNFSSSCGLIENNEELLKSLEKKKGNIFNLNKK